MRQPPPSRARNLGRAADGKKRGASMGWSGLNLAALVKESCCGPCRCRRVLQHATPGRVKARRIGRCVRTCAHFPGAVRTRGQEFPGACLPLLPLILCCCCCTGRAG